MKWPMKLSHLHDHDDDHENRDVLAAYENCK